MRQRLIGFLRIAWMELEALNLLPTRIGRYIIVDWLQSIEDQFSQISAGAGVGTREKMVHCPDVPPADISRGTDNEKT